MTQKEHEEHFEQLYRTSKEVSNAMWSRVMQDPYSVKGFNAHGEETVQVSVATKQRARNFVVETVHGEEDEGRERLRLKPSIN